MKKIFVLLLILLMIPVFAYSQDRPGFRRGNVTAYEAFFDSMTVTGRVTFDGAATFTPSLTVRANPGGAGPDSSWTLTFVSGSPVMTWNSAGGATGKTGINPEDQYYFSGFQSVGIGISDSESGNLSIRGDNADQGAIIILYNSGNEDNTEDNWGFEATGVTLDIGVPSDYDVFQFTNDGSFLARKAITVGDDALNLDGTQTFVDAGGNTLTMIFSSDLLTIGLAPVTIDSTLIWSHGYPEFLASGEYTGETVHLLADENLTFGQVCYVDADGEQALAKADAAGTMGAWVMALGSISIDTRGLFLLTGFVAFSGFDDLNAEGTVYVSAGTAGGITTTQPAVSTNISQKIGVCIDVTDANETLHFNPDATLVTVP